MGGWRAPLRGNYNGISNLDRAQAAGQRWEEEEQTILRQMLCQFWHPFNDLIILSYHLKVKVRGF